MDKPTKGLEMKYDLAKKLLIKNNWQRSSGNTERLSETVYTFQHYNFLPSKKIPFDGHYTFFVDVANFNWRAYKSSDYGSFTYVTEVEPPETLLGPNDFSVYIRKHITNLIVCQMLSAYFYDSEHVNQQGPNLIDPPFEKGNKGTLITDYRGYIWTENNPEQYSREELIALKELIDWEPKEYKLEIDARNDFRKCIHDAQRIVMVREFMVKEGIGNNTEI